MKLRLLFVIAVLFSVKSFADPYYWVGGSGNWADLNHWATSSGGTTYHTTIPGSSDDIIFDSNSGSSQISVTINVNTVYGRNISILNSSPAVVFTNNDANFEIFGSIFLRSGCDIPNGGSSIYNLAGIGNHTITSNGATFGKIIQNGSGSYSLADSLTSTYSINLYSGSFYSNGKKIRVRTINSNHQSVGDTSDFSGSLIVLNDDWNALDLRGYSKMDFSNSIVKAIGYRPNIRLQAVDTIRLNELHIVGNESSILSSNLKGRIHKLFVDNTHLFQSISKIDSLMLEGTTTLVFEGNSTPVKIGQIVENLNCDDFIHMQGREVGSTIKELELLNPCIISQLSVMNLDVSGSTLTGTRGFDVGKSSGVLFGTFFPTTYYWIGGTGDWNDPGNWSLNSGGTAANCAPRLLDNIVFDNNSSTGPFVVTLKDQIHVGNVQMNPNQQLDFTNRSSFYVEGSFESNSNVNFSVSGGTLAFTSQIPSVDSISCQNPIQANLNFLGDGTWHLTDSLITNGAFRIINGRFLMPNAYLEGDNFSERYFMNWGFNAGDSIRMNIKNAHLKFRSFEFREQTKFNWNYRNSLFELNATGNRSCHFDASHPFWELRVSDPGADYDFHWNSFAAKLFTVYGTVEFRNQFLGKDHAWDTLRVYENSAIMFESPVKKNIHINKFDAVTNCFGYATLSGYSPSDTLKIIQNGDSISVNYMLINNVLNGTPNRPFKANTSIDLGGNTDITFTQPAPRTLYWVGDGGSWSDSTHWSLSSGGIGGECLPTLADSVIFDLNSFSTINSVVDLNDEHGYARDFVVVNPIQFIFRVKNNGSLKIFRDMRLTEDLDFDAGWSSYIFFKGADTANLFTNGAIMDLRLHVEKDNAAPLILRDSIHNGYGISVYHGGFLSGSNYIQNASFRAENSSDTVYVDLGASTLELWNSWDAFSLRGSNVNYTSDSAHIYLISDRVYANIEIADTVEHIEYTNQNNLDYSRIRFSNGGHVEFLKPHANLRFDGSSSIDTLILTPDQVYTYQAGITHVIHDSLRARGDFCHYIGLKSSAAGTQSYIVTNSTVAADFLEIRDLNYSGNQSFYTGAKSNDQGNNSGFIWSNKPGYIYGFPADTTYLFCHDSLYTDSLLLTTINFNDAQGFLWSTGDTSDFLWVNQSGEYWVEADYITCKVYDTIVVSLDYKAPLTYDQYVCVGSPTTLTANNGDSAYSYLWSDGSVGHTITPTITQDTTFWVDIYIGNRYSCTDTVHISGIEIVSVVDASINPSCHLDQDGSIALSAVSGGFGPYTYSWAHDPNLQLPNAANLGGGCYGFTIEDTLGCLYSDTLCLTAPQPLEISYQLTLPNCKGDSATLTGINPIGGTGPYNLSYSFNAALLPSLPSGNYQISVSDANGCSHDTTFEVYHTFEFNYNVLIDTATCGENNGGVQVIPTLNPNIYSYTWSAYPGYSNSGQIFMGASNGFIYLTDSVAGCLDTIYYEVPSAGATNANFFLDQDSGISPLTVQTINLNNAPGIIDYWILDGDTVSNQRDTSFVFPGYGNYLLTHCVFDPQYGCLFCTEKWIIVLPNPKIEIPNFFTPNDDGTNDFFELSVGQDLEEVYVEVYNRWGTLMYKSYETDFRWDGYGLNGLKSSDGVYFWILTYKEVNNDEIMRAQGTVTLMR